MLEAQLGRWLTRRGWTLAVAETTTGGLISSRIVGVPGSSAYFDRGIVVYSKASKVEMLGVSEALLEMYGAVSEETATALARGVRQISGATLGLAETGIAGPLRGRSPKPIGFACIVLATPQDTRCEAFVFEGDRQEIRDQIAEQALALAVSYVEDRTFCA